MPCFTGSSPHSGSPGTEGGTWKDVPFTDEMPRLCTRRIVRFLDPENGYAGLGTDWTMGTGGATYVYWTHDGGETWTSSASLCEDGLMLDGLAFADVSNGVASLQSVNGDEQVPGSQGDCGRGRFLFRAGPSVGESSAGRIFPR